MNATALLAHAGGWDEAAFIALPVALFGGLLMVANKRAAALQREGQQNSSDRDDDSDPADGADEGEPEPGSSEEPPP